MQIFSVSELESPWSVLLDQTPLQLDRDGIKEREDGERGGGWLFEGGDYFKYFRLKGAIIPGRRLIEGRLLFKEILWYFALNLFFIATHKEKNPAAGW